MTENTGALAVTTREGKIQIIEMGSIQPSLKQSISIALENLEDALEYFDSEFPEDNWLHIRKLADRDGESPSTESPEDLKIVNHRKRRKPKAEKYREIEKALISASLSISEAKQSLAKNAQDSGRLALENADNKLNFSQTLAGPIISGKTNRARKSGNAAAKNAAEKAKTKRESVIAFLTTDRPKGGWRSHIDAAEKIAQLMLATIGTGKLSSSEDRKDLVHYILNLIIDDKDVKKAFNSL